jgi:hypothetical protein
VCMPPTRWSSHVNPVGEDGVPDLPHANSRIVDGSMVLHWYHRSGRRERQLPWGRGVEVAVPATGALGASERLRRRRTRRGRPPSSVRRTRRPTRDGWR